MVHFHRQDAFLRRDRTLQESEAHALYPALREAYYFGPTKKALFQLMMVVTVANLALVAIRTET